MNVAAVALEANPEEKDISKHIKVCMQISRDVGGMIMSLSLIHI